MSFPVTLLDLAGFIALLLWGTHMVQTGVQRAFGANLRTILNHALRNRGRAFFAGMGVTALLQSSTATGLMVTGLAAGGMVALVPALAVMLGANVGTTLIVQLLSFDIAAVSPVLILIGVLLFRRDSSTQAHDLGRVLIGLGLMLLALHQLLDLLQQFEDAPNLQMLLGAVSTMPVVCVLLAAVITWATHSSVAIVLLVMSLADNGVVSPNAAFALVLGANLGTAINPLLEGNTGGDPAARRLPIGNLITRVVGVGIVLAVLPQIGKLLVVIEPDPARAVAMFHTLFNVAVALTFLPVLTPYARLLTRLMPDAEQAADPARPIYLDNAAKETPIVALAGAAREALRLVDILDAMLAGAREAIAKGDRRLIAETRKRDDLLDHLNMAIKTYLTSLDPEEMSTSDQRRCAEILSFSMSIEQAGDVVDRNLLPHVIKRLKRGLIVSAQEKAELTEMMDRLISNLRVAASSFVTEDARAARLLADEKIAFRTREAEATERHFERMRLGRIEAARSSALHLDLVRDMKLINSHLVAAAAYPILERSGQLLRSRLAAE